MRGHGGKHQLEDAGFWVPPAGPAQQRFSSRRLAVERRPVADLGELLAAEHPVGLPLDRVVREPAATPGAVVLRPDDDTPSRRRRSSGRC